MAEFDARLADDAREDCGQGQDASTSEHFARDKPKNHAAKKANTARVSEASASASDSADCASRHGGRHPKHEAMGASVGNDGHSCKMRKSSDFSAHAVRATKRTDNPLSDSKLNVALQLTLAMEKENITKTKLAKLMGTSRSQIDRLLDPDNNNYTLETISRAAKFLGRQVRLELI